MSVLILKKDSETVRLQVGITPAGAKGEKGDSVPIANSLGQSDTQAVSQKLLTDTLGDIDSILTQINGV